MAKPVLEGPAGPVIATRDRGQLERLRTLTRVLDNAISIPGTRYRFGLDALIGLVPGLGDIAGAIFSVYFILQAARLGAPRSTLLRMLGNVGIDTLVGEVPLLGDLFDFGWKSNTRNLALLEAHLQQPSRAKAESRRVIALLVGAAVVLLIAVVAVGVLVAKLVLELVK